MHDLPFLADEQKLYDNIDKNECNSNTSETLNQNIDHTEEVIIGNRTWYNFSYLNRCLSMSCLN